MNNKTKHYRVGLLGHYGQNNLGDEAIIWSTIQNLRERIPDIELVGVSMNPEDSRRRFGIEAFPVRYIKTNLSNKKNIRANSDTPDVKESGLIQVIRHTIPQKIKGMVPMRTKMSANGFFYLLRNLAAEVQFIYKSRDLLKTLDALIICGSGQIEDFSGPWRYPYTILKWVLLAKSVNKKVLVVSVGAGPPSRKLSYWMYKKALRRADYLSYRDLWSKNVLESHISRLNGKVFPDLANSLKTKSVNGYKGGSKVVAINPMPAFDSTLMKGAGNSVFENYVNNIAALSNHALERGFKVHFFNSHPKDLTAIEKVLEQLKLLTDSNLDKLTIKRSNTVQDLVNTISEADLILPTRFHATMLPLLLGRPVLGLCYHDKSKALLEEVGLGEYYVDIYSFTDDELCKKFDLLVENLERAEMEMKRKYSKYPKLMSEQWDRVVDLILS